MTVNTTWSNPSAASGSGGTDLGNEVLTEVVWDRVQSNAYRLGGTDGNTKTGKLEVGDHGLTTYSNANNTAGITIHQGAADDEALSAKNSGVNHTLTAMAEGSTFFAVKKVQDTAGGAMLMGLSETSQGIRIRGLVTTEENTRTTSATAAVVIEGGGNNAALSANVNLVCVGNYGTMRFFLDSDGDSHQDVGTAWSNFSDHDDVGLLNLLSAHVTRENDPLRERFRDFLEERREQLEELRLVQFNPDGHHFVNMSRLTMLLVGASVQLGKRLSLMEERLSGLLPSPPG